MNINQFIKSRIFQLYNILLGRKNKSLEHKTKDLRLHKRSDVERWSQNKALHENWNERTELLASFLTDSAKIIEFGAGVMHMKKLIKPNQIYTPSDLIKRFPDTVVFDLNEPINIDLSAYNTVVFSGVLEYVYDVEFLFKRLNNENINRIILSYCCSDLMKVSREKNGWLSDYTKFELEIIFKKNNYKIINYEIWNSQSIFNLLKN
jgi:hypothetical protein